jgi:hypothetical protein
MLCLFTEDYVKIDWGTMVPRINVENAVAGS